MPQQVGAGRVGVDRLVTSVVDVEEVDRLVLAALAAQFAVVDVDRVWAAARITATGCAFPHFHPHSRRDRLGGHAPASSSAVTVKHGHVSPQPMQ